MNCLACRDKVSRDERLFCSDCKGVYHYACQGIPQEYYIAKLKNVNNSWRCSPCNNVTRRNKNDNTPVRRSYEGKPPGQEQADMSICDEPQQDRSTSDQSTLEVNLTCNNGTTTELSIDTLSSLLDSKLAGIKGDLVRIDSKIGSTKQEIFKEINNEFTRVLDRIKEEFSETTDFLSDQIKSFQVELSAVSKKVKDLEQENSRLNAELLCVKNNPSPQANVVQLQLIVEQLQMELNDKDQSMLLNDVEISGVPEHQGESPLHIAQALAQKVGMQLDTRDVVSVERVGPLRATSGGEGARTRPRPLVARLARRALRDELLRNARVRRNLDTSSIGLPDHNACKVYINERLTKANRKLLWKARQAGSAAGWRFIWTKEGRIFAKRTEGTDSRGVRIQHEKDIVRVFGLDPTVSENK